MTTFKIELVIRDDSLVNPNILGHDISRKTIYRGTAANESLAVYEAECICGKFDTPKFNTTRNGRKFRTSVLTRTLYDEHDHSSTLVVTLKSEL